LRVTSRGLGDVYKRQIQGVMGEIYPIKEDIFLMTYEAVE
jgi:hypothetical protein